VRLDLHLHHLQGPAQNTTEDIRVPELILGAAVIGKFDKVGERVLVEYEGKLFAVARPVGDGGGDVEEDFEPNLCMKESACCGRVGVGAAVEPTLAIISAVSLKFEHRRIVLDLAR